MSLSPSQPVEDPTKEDIQKEEVKQLKSPSPPRSKLEAFLRKELEFLGAAQTMIGLICFFFGVIHKFILNFLKHKKDLFSTFHMGYPIWGGLLHCKYYNFLPPLNLALSKFSILGLWAKYLTLGIAFTISGFLLIASERKGTKCLVQSSLVMAILSSVVAGIGIWIIWSDLKQISSIFYQCQNQQTGDFCFAVTFLTETAVMVLFLTVLELGIGILLSVNEIIGKIVETWIAKHRKTHHEAFYEELPIYYPITENVELLRQGSVSIGPKDTSESRESLHSRIYQSPEELQKT